MTEKITTSDAAKILGVTQKRVQAMIRSGRLRAKKIARDWFIAPADMDAVRDRKPGRPRKT